MQLFLIRLRCACWIFELEFINRIIPLFWAMKLMLFEFDEKQHGGTK